MAEDEAKIEDQDLIEGDGGEIDGDLAREVAGLEALLGDVMVDRDDDVREMQRVYRQEMTQLVFVLGWCGWLLASWVLTLMINGADQTMRWMVLSVGFGQIMIWPALRLSQEMDLLGGKIRWLVLRDWFSMMIILQMVVWPLKYKALWDWGQTFMMVGLMMGIGLVVGLLIVWGGRRQNNWGSSLGMLGCLGLGFGGIIWRWLFGAGVKVVSPFETLWGMAADPRVWRVEDWFGDVMVLGLVGVLGWVGVMWRLRD